MKCFVIAMEKEAKPLIAKMDVESDEVICGKRVILGILSDREVCVIVCGVGKVNAACGAQLAIDKFGADEIINIGVAGGLEDTVRVGEIYSVAAAVQYDFDLTQLNGTPIGTLDECKENYLPLTYSERYPFRWVATGDRFNDSKEDYKLLTEVVCAQIRDMECAAIAQACMHANVKFRAYKIISDLAGSGSTTEQYLKNLSLCFDTLTRELENIAEDIYG